MMPLNYTLQQYFFFCLLSFVTQALYCRHTITVAIVMHKSLNTTLYTALKFYKHLRCYYTVTRMYLEHQCAAACCTVYHYAST